MVTFDGIFSMWDFLSVTYKLDTSQYIFRFINFPMRKLKLIKPCASVKIVKKKAELKKAKRCYLVHALVSKEGSTLPKMLFSAGNPMNSTSGLLTQLSSVLTIKSGFTHCRCSLSPVNKGRQWLSWTKRIGVKYFDYSYSKAHLHSHFFFIPTIFSTAWPLVRILPSISSFSFTDYSTL